MTNDEFSQPSLGDPQHNSRQYDAGEFRGKRPPAIVDNSGKTDALSQAVAAQRKVVAPVAEAPRGPGAYQLDYVYNGELIHETHETIPHAVARVAALKRLGIVPATSVAE